MRIQNCTEIQGETKETNKRDYGDHGDQQHAHTNCIESQGETKETIETMETSNMQIQNYMERQRLEETEETRETMETSGDTCMEELRD